VERPTEIITTHHVELDVAEADEVVERLRESLPRYLTDLEGLVSAALYRSQDGSEILLIGRWRDLVSVARSMETIYAEPDLGAGEVDARRFSAYILVDEVARAVKR
jgi:hypothetical protein